MAFTFNPFTGTFDYFQPGATQLTTKGDILGYSTVDARIPVGTNGQFLQSDSTKALGVAWVTATGTGNITSINSDATAAQTLTAGTTGTDFAIVDDAAGGHAFNLPSASATARGLVSTGTQTLAGAKTFSSATIVSDSTDASSSTTGSFKTAGGLGVAKKLYVGTLCGIGTSSTFGFNNQQLTVANLDAGTSSANLAIMGLCNETTNTAGSGNKVGIIAQYNRTISSNTTDTCTPASFWSSYSLTAASATYTNAQSQGWSALYVSAFNLISGTAAITNVAAINIQADSAVTGTNKYAVRTGNMSGASNNYQLNLGTGISKFADTTASTSSTTGSAVFAGGLGIAGNSVIAGTFKYGNYHLEPTENNAGNSSTAQTIDWSTGSSQLSTLTGSVTYTFTNPQSGGSYVLRIATGAGSFTATWPGTVKWSGGTAPTITATASKVDLINFYWDGTSYYGSFVQNF